MTQVEDYPWSTIIKWYKSDIEHALLMCNIAHMLIALGCPPPKEDAVRSEIDHDDDLRLRWRYGRIDASIQRPYRESTMLFSIEVGGAIRFERYPRVGTDEVIVATQDFVCALREFGA